MARGRWRVVSGAWSVTRGETHAVTHTESATQGQPHRVEQPLGQNLLGFSHTGLVTQGQSEEHITGR